MTLSETFEMELARYGIKCYGVTEEGSFLLVYVDRSEQAARIIGTLGTFPAVTEPSPGILMVIKDDLPGDRPVSLPGTYCGGCSHLSTNESPCWYWAKHSLWLCFICSIVFVPLPSWLET